MALNLRMFALQELPPVVAECSQGRHGGTAPTEPHLIAQDRRQSIADKISLTKYSVLQALQQHSHAMKLPTAPS